MSKKAIENLHFIFDLDGTLTTMETLPVIGKYFHIEHDIASITQRAISGSVPYVENFIRRVSILGHLPVNEIAFLLSRTPMHDKVLNFIESHRKNCSIATTNLDVWIAELANLIPCKVHCSQAIVENNAIKKIKTILKKEALVNQMQCAGYKVVFIGDGNNDQEAMRLADISIASGLTHEPAPGVLAFADYLCYEDNILCQFLERLY